MLEFSLFSSVYSRALSLITQYLQLSLEKFSFLNALEVIFPISFTQLFPFYLFPKTSREIIVRFSVVVIPHIRLTTVLPQPVTVNTSMVPCSATQIPFSKLGNSLASVPSPVHPSPLPQLDSLANRILISWSINFLLPSTHLEGLPLGTLGLLTPTTLWKERTHSSVLQHLRSGLEEGSLAPPTLRQPQEKTFPPSRPLNSD